MPRRTSSDDRFLFRRRSRFQLTDLMCRQAGPGRHADGDCLYLYVRDSGSRSWIVRLTISGQRCDFGLGPYPLVPLVRARELAAEYRGIAREGGHPRRTVDKSVPTVREAADSLIEDLKNNWTVTDAEARYRRGLELRVFPKLGDTRVDQVTVDHCFDLVHPLWQGRGSMGFRLRHQLAHLMKWAVGHKYRNDNPAEQVLVRLPKVKSRLQHQPSLPYTQAPAAMAALQSAQVPPVVKLVIPFIVITAVRLREATEATWSEFDFDNHVWTIPARRMKKRRLHRVPLSDQAIQILEDARDLYPSGVLVFGFRNGRRPPRALTSAEISKVLRALNLTDVEGRNVVIHGFRSTFTDWAADDSSVSVEAAEAALAHQPDSDTRQAYRRHDMLKPRCLLMQKWADYVLPLERP